MSIECSLECKHQNGDGTCSETDCKRVTVGDILKLKKYKDMEELVREYLEENNFDGLYDDGDYWTAHPRKGAQMLARGYGYCPRY